jgi:YkoP domain
VFVSSVVKLRSRLAEARESGGKWSRLAGATSRAGRGAVSACDNVLRRILRIREFSEQPDCLLRVAYRRCKGRELALQDGTKVRWGDSVCELHFWNEHVTSVLDVPGGLGVGARLRTEMMNSLASLAVWAAINPELRDVRAFHARVCRALHGGRKEGDPLLERQGFTVLPRRPPLPGRIHDFLERMLMRALVWRFNPSPPHRRRMIARFDIWISRDDLIRRYGPVAAAAETHKRPGVGSR